MSLDPARYGPWALIVGGSEGLGAAWKKIRPVRLNDLSCNCEYLEVCRGGCRFRAELYAGINGRDPYRCTLYGTI